MLIDGNSIKKDRRINTDICIVGAGIAGIHLAVILLKTGIKIVLLEAGETKYNKNVQEAHRFITTGLPIEQESRIITYGGTSTVWKGKLRPLDDIDFEKRDWVPNSGWPFSKDKLIPYYNKAAVLLGIPKVNDFTIDKRSMQNFLPYPPFEPNILYGMRKTNWDFGKRFKETLQSSKDITILTNSNVTRLETNENGKIVTTVKVQTLQGNRFELRAKHFVLATGGIENARLLLLSKSKQHPKGIGNINDIVGRYYMDHPKFRSGVLFFNKNIDISNQFGIGTLREKYRIKIKLSESSQRKYRLLNSYIRLNSKYRKTSIFRRKNTHIRQVEIKNYMEQAPIPSNRITLSKEKDVFGLPRASIHWSLSPLDKKTIIYIHKLINETKNATKEYSFESSLLNGTCVWNVEDSSHHMGTTRMGKNPETSVTNEDARVHDIKNLYITGSSLFPTSGYANPTYTIFALTQKLSEHLKKKYKK